MYIRPHIVFQTPFYDPQYRQFRNPSELQKFLAGFDFMRPHMVSRLQTGLPEFQLGTKLEFTLDGYFCESDIKWGPNLLVGRNVRTAGNKILVDVPMDAPPNASADSMMVSHAYQTIQIYRDMADAVVDLRTMRQLWPLCEESRSEYVKFLTAVNRQRFEIKAR